MIGVVPALAKLVVSVGELSFGLLELICSAPPATVGYLCCDKIEKFDECNDFFGKRMVESLVHIGLGMYSTAYSVVSIATLGFGGWIIEGCVSDANKEASKCTVEDGAVLCCCGLCCLASSFQTEPQEMKRSGKK